MLPADNDLLKKLKKEAKRSKVIIPGDTSKEEPFEQDTLSHLKKALDALKNPFKWA